MPRIARLPTRTAAACAVAAWILAPASLCRAAELALGDTPYAYTVIDQDLRSALREFGANLGLRLTMTDAVQGRIRGRLPPLAPRAFLDRVATLYGLDWYYDGYAIAVSAQSEGLTTVLTTPGVSFPELKSGLEAMGVWDPRYAVRPQPGQDMVVVAGPPHFVQMTEQLAGLLVAQAAARTPPPAAAGPAPAVAGAPAPRTSGITVFRSTQEQRVTFGGN